MTPHQISLVERTLVLIREDPDAVARPFYDRFFELAPEVRPMFGTDLDAQRAKFITTLDAVFGAISAFDEFVAQSTALGERHVEYGARPAHYALAGAALQDVLADVLRKDVQEEEQDDVEETLAAWRMAWNLVAEMMMAASDGVGT